jgi:hypothetical protein
MTERRYTEDEAAEIFRVAAELEERVPRALAPAEGLTIAELQAIGREAGLSPELVARAARRAAEPPATAFRFLGLPIGVSRTVEIDEPLADGDWEQLVSELRETFEAKGVVRYDGPFRQWSNGNLHVLVEPTPAGHRLRFRTRNGMSQSMLSGGLITMAGAAAMFLVGAFTAGADPMRGAAMLGLIGAGMFTFGAMRLPAWARRRQEQMNALAERFSGR